MGLTDPDRVRSQLVATSVAARPLLCGGRGLMDAGSGVGVPGLALALADPARPTWLVEPNARNLALMRWLMTDLPPSNTQLIDRPLEEVAFHRLPRVQVVTRAALSWETLQSALPGRAGPVVRWSGPDVSLPPDRSDWTACRITVRVNSRAQTLDWWGPTPLFHVKHSRWRKRKNLEVGHPPAGPDQPVGNRPGGR